MSRLSAPRRVQNPVQGDVRHELLRQSRHKNEVSGKIQGGPEKERSRGPGGVLQPRHLRHMQHRGRHV